MEGKALAEPRNILEFLTADHADEYRFLATRSEAQIISRGNSAKARFKERREHESFLGFVVPPLGGLDDQRMNVNRINFNLNPHPQFCARNPQNHSITRLRDRDLSSTPFF